MAYEAVHRFARISARKVRPLADLIRGKFADEALDMLRYQPQRGARMLEKVLKSALGNAEDRRAPNVGDLRGGRRPGRRRADVQADAAAGPRHGLHDQEADVAHSRGVGSTTSANAAAIAQRSGRPTSTREQTYGSKSQSDRFSHGHHDRLEEPLVRLEAGVRRPAGRGPEDPQVRQGQVQVRRHRQDRDRADPRRSEGHPVRGPAGRDHRPQGAGGRAAAGRAAEPDRPADQHQDRGNQPAGDCRPNWWPRTSPSSWPSGPASAAR